MLELTKEALAKSLEPEVRPHLILEIDGIDEVFGYYPIVRTAKIGDKGLVVGGGWKIGGFTENPNSRPYISLTGSSSQLSQQLEQDKGGSGSIGSLTIELVDKSEEITRLVSEQVEVDLLYRKATVYFAFKDTSHPKDSIRILTGVITDLKAKQGSYIFTIQYPEALKKQSLFTPVQSSLVSALTAGANEFVIEECDDFQTLWKNFIKIDDEWIRFFGVEKLSSGNVRIYDLVRGSRGTTAAAHDAGADISSAVQVQGSLIDLALQLMLSGGNGTEPVKVIAINQVSPDKRLDNTLLFPYDVKSKFGLSIGDKVYLSNESESFYREITGFGSTDFGYYITVSSAGAILVTNTDPDINAVFKSKYNISDDKNAGLGIPLEMVDVSEHEKLRTLYGNTFFPYNFFITEEIEAQTLINEQILFPAGLYQLPRSGKISVGMTRAPLADSATVIDASNILNANELSVQRSVNKYFYNSICYKYEKSDDEEKFLSSIIHYSADSAAKIKIRNTALTISCQGIRKDSNIKKLIDACATRFLNRYQFASEYIQKVKVNFKTGFKIEVGDCVLFGEPSLKIADMKNGTRSFEPRLMEVVNKRLDLKTGQVELDLLDTNFEESGRYGVIAPSGVISSATSSSLSFGTWALSKNKTAKDVWGAYVGQHIEWHNDNWSRVGSGEIADFDELDHNKMVIINMAGQVAQKGDIVSPMRYSSNSKIDRVFKKIFCYLNPSPKVVNGISSLRFSVSNLYLPFFHVGSPIIVHNSAWSIKSEEVKVISIVGNEILVPDLGFIPTNTMSVELVGFSDGGALYRLI